MKIKNIEILFLISILFYGINCAPNIKQVSELNGYKSQAENIISNAEEKIKIARENGAEKYSLDNLNNAISSLKLAKAYYNEGVIQHKKSYAKAKDNYLKAIKYGNSAIASAELAMKNSEAAINIENAKKAIEYAKKVEAEKYSPQKTGNAIASLETAQINYDAGNYPLAKELASKAIKLANDAKEEAELKKKNFDDKHKRFEKAKSRLTESLKKNDINIVIEDTKELLSAEIDLIKYKIDSIDREDEKVISKQLLAKLKKTETGILSLIDRYYKAKKERDDAERKVKDAREERDSLKEKLSKLKAKIDVISKELKELIVKKDLLIEPKTEKIKTGIKKENK
ncbi:MAG: hypothetical protein AB1498_11440 [bacterium]